MQYVIIPDIHGHADKLQGLLHHIGWQRHGSGWKSGQPNEEIVFLGDFIDRGSENASVIRTVRSLIDAGKAHAVMGNHELNAIHFHTRHPVTGDPLRSHTEKTLRQHQSFLREFKHESSDAADVITWMRTLPLFLEFPSFRAVHASWNENAIQQLTLRSQDGVLSEDQMIAAADKSDPLFELTEITTKGPEVPLPAGYGFSDKDGTNRTDIRVQWWASNAARWADIAMSVPNIDGLPKTPLPGELVSGIYPSNAKPVFFGHYWLTGQPTLQAPNAICLDYSAGKDGPLLAYRVPEDLTHEIALANIITAPE
jgi:hypothetical protein